MKLEGIKPGDGSLTTAYGEARKRGAVLVCDEVLMETVILINAMMVNDVPLVAVSYQVYKGILESGIKYDTQKFVVHNIEGLLEHMNIPYATYQKPWED